jgi:hypothetical protein
MARGIVTPRRRDASRLGEAGFARVEPGPPCGARPVRHRRTSISVAEKGSIDQTVVQLFWNSLADPRTFLR